MTQTELPKYTAIQFPGLVENEDKAISMLGGKSKVGKMLSNPNAPISLDFKQTHFSTKITGQTSKVNYLLAEVDEDFNCEIIGKMNTVLHFSAMADYHMDTERDAKMDDLRTAIETSDIDSILKFDFAHHQFPQGFEPPPMFTIKTYPTEYQFKGQKYDKSKRSIWPKVLPIDFCLDQVVVPNELPLEEYEKYTLLLSKDLQTLLQRAVIAFETRPIMTSVCLANLLDVNASDSDPNFRYIKSKILPLLAYFVTKGPLRYCYIKLGFDPRDNPHVSRRYQVADAASKKYKLRQIIKDQHPSHIFDGVNTNAYMIVHLCDLTDPVMAPLINDMAFHSDYSNYGGFYEDRDLAAIREVFRRRYANVVLNENNEIPETLEEAKLLNLKITKHSYQVNEVESVNESEDAISDNNSAVASAEDDFDFNLDEIVGTNDTERNYVQMNDLSKEVDAMLDNVNL